MGLWLLLMLKGEPSQEILLQPSLGAGQPAGVGPVVTTFLMSFACSSGKWLSRESQRWRRPRHNSGHAAPKGLGSGSSPEPWRLPWQAGFYPTPLGPASLLSRRGRTAPCWFCIFERRCAASLLSPRGPTPCRATSSRRQRSPHGGKCGRPADVCRLASPRSAASAVGSSDKSGSSWLVGARN